MNTTFQARRQPRALDAVLFGFFVYDGFGMPGFPILVPVSELAAIALVGISLFRRPRLTLGSSHWLFPVFILLLTYLIIESAYNDADWFRRAFRLCVMITLVWALTTGRLNMVSGLKGVGVALAINVILFYLGVAPDNYAGALTGYLGDKNVAGLYYTIFPLLISALLKKKSQQLTCIAFGLLAAFLTGSRTSLAAYAVALLWLLLARRLSIVARGVLAMGLVTGLQYAEMHLARVWIFSDREGTDALRERIDEAAAAKTDLAPWYGLGLGESQVSMNNRTWLFHDSYLALLVEGGWIILIVIVGIYIWFGFHPLSGIPRSKSILILEAATLALLVCGSKLGEVFLSLPGFILIAYGVNASVSRNSCGQPSATIVKVRR